MHHCLSLGMRLLGLARSLACLRQCFVIISRRAWFHFVKRLASIFADSCFVMIYELGT